MIERLCNSVAYMRYQLSKFAFNPTFTHLRRNVAKILHIFERNSAPQGSVLSLSVDTEHYIGEML
jgi:hypothetical protein